MYGKISTITKKDGTGITYSYDASGNHISKTVTRGNSSEVTSYVRDAQGNVLAVYTYNGKNLSDGKLLLSELHLYGSIRLGIWQRSIDMEASPDPGKNIPGLGPIYTEEFIRGEQHYELTNHLSNVLVTISDKKIAVPSPSNSSLIDHYEPDVVSAQDYTSSGALEYGRSFNSGSSRYGFNGKEEDNEMYGQGNAYDFGDRIYDPMIGRWLSTDPLQKKYSGETPYLYTGGNPVLFTDPDGKDRIEYVRIITDKYTVVIKKVTAHEFKAKADGRYAGAGYYYYKDNIESYTTYDFRSGILPDKRYSSVTRQDYSSGKEIDFWEFAKVKLLGRDDALKVNMPQVVVFGSGTEDPGWGSKADPNKPVYTFDYAKFSEIMDLITVGMEAEKPEGGIDKLPELLKKGLDQKLDNMLNKEPETNQSNQGRTNSKPYSGYKKGAILHTNTGNVQVDSDSTGTCCQDGKKATDTIPELKKKKEN